MRTRFVISLPVLFVCAWVLFAVGCGDSSGLHTLHGTVTYKGEKVPKGFITFSPDSEKGNNGPGGGAAIVNGKYRTENGKGVVGGPYVIRIVGYDGKATTVSGEQLPDGQALFTPYEIRRDLPKKSKEVNFEVAAGK